VDTSPEEPFDRLADLAQALFDAPVGMVTFVGEDRQWHKAVVGTDLTAVPREHAFCAYCIETAGPTVIEDLADHEQFSENPFVTGEAEGPSFRFYAGAPIASAEGHRLGSVCVLDETPRSPSSGLIRQLEHLAALASEMLEQRRTEEHRRVRAQLRRTQEVAEVAGWEYDPQTDTFTGTAQLYELMGVPPDTPLGKDDALQFYPPEVQDKVAAASRRCLEEGESFDLEVPFLPETGGRRWVRTQGEAHMEDGEVVLVTGTLQDITEQKRQERALERQNDLFAKAQEIAQVGAWEYDVQSETQVLTNQVYRIHGLSPRDELTPEESIEFYHPEDQEAIREAFARAVREGVPYDLELRLIDANGRQRWVRTRGEPQLENGEVVRVRGTLQDVTGRKEMGETLRKQKELLSSVTEHISEGIFRSTQEDGIVYANQAFVDMFGYDSLEALAEAPPTALYADPDQREALYCDTAEREALDRAEVRFQRKDGSTFVGLVSIRKVEGELGAPDYYDGAVTDITDRRRQKEQLRERQQKVEALYEATSRLLRAESEDEVADLLVTLIGETLGYSGTTIRFVEGDQIEASRVPDMVRRYMPERPAYDLHGDTPAAEALRTGETQMFEDLSAEDPSLDRGEIRATAYVPMEEHGLISVGSREVGGIGPFDLRLIEVLGGYAALVLGRLDRVETLRQAKEEAEEANRLKSVLLANINHEFRTPLTTIISSSRLIEEDPARADRFASRILAGGERLLHTLNTVMDFAELEGGQMTLTPREVDLRALLSSSADDVREMAHRKNLTLTLDPPETSVPVRLDQHHVRRICIHLLSNAIKFTDGDGAVITIGGRLTEDDVTIWVEDPGIGIHSAFQSRMFDEFVQASSGNDRTHEGNGLGLTIVKRLVDRMDGTINVDSAPGEGTRVTVHLPRMGPDVG
jgi:PAS domain S-box-containing protein